jgi:methionine-rich copper-binding protein CopC
LRKGRVEVRVVVASHPERVEILSHWVETERRIANVVDPDGKGGNKEDTQTETQQERPPGEETALLINTD